MSGSVAPPAYVSSDEEEEEITAQNVRSVPYRAPPPGLEPPAGRIKLKGTIVPVYTLEQQGRLGVDANGSDRLEDLPSLGAGGGGGGAAAPSKAARDAVAEADAAMAAAAAEVGLEGTPEGKLPTVAELQSALKTKSKEGMAALQAFATMDLSWAHEMMVGHEGKSQAQLAADAKDAQRRMEAAKSAEEDYLAEQASRGNLRSGMDFNTKYMVHIKALEAGMDAYDGKKGAYAEHLEKEMHPTFNDKEADGELVGVMTREEMEKGKPGVEE